MELADVLGLTSGILTSIRFLPQVHKTLKMRETRDISVWFLIIVAAQAILLMFYGYVKPDRWILYMNVVPGICSFILLYFKWRYR